MVSGTCWKSDKMPEGDNKSLCKLPAETAVTALPVGKPARAFQSLSDTGFSAQPLLVQRMVKWQIPLLVGAHSVGIHGGLGEAR
jgi:hypothetical protein